MATRALRHHLDALPIDYDLGTTPDRFLAGFAFMFARQRYDLTDSMIGAGFGGTVLGSMARSLFVDGMRWLWILELPDRRRHLLGSLLEERTRLCTLLDESDTSCPNLPRWLMPIPDVADLTGASGSWLTAEPMPNDEHLVDHFLRQADRPLPAGSEPADSHHARVRQVLDLAGLRGAVLVLAHAGHGNYLGLQSALSEDGAPAHDLRQDHEALFMQVAAAGAVATLLGYAAAVPESWPTDVDREPFLEEAVHLATEIAAAAVVLHRLGTRTRGPRGPERQPRVRPPIAAHPRAILSGQDLQPDIADSASVELATERFYSAVRDFTFDPWAHGNPTLHEALNYGAGLSGLTAAMSTYNQPGSGVVSAFAGRMLLEESARLRWRFAVAGEERFRARASQYFDEFRSRRRKAINLLTGSGVSHRDAEHLFALPSNVQVVSPHDRVAPHRTPLPSIRPMLREMGSAFGFAEPGWLEVAYSLLSQVTHSTPIGLLHTIRRRDGGWHGNEISPEMLALALDVTCLGSAYMIGHSALILTNLSPEAHVYRRALAVKAAEVHQHARLVHGLD